MVENIHLKKVLDDFVLYLVTLWPVITANLAFYRMYSNKLKTIRLGDAIKCPLDIKKSEEFLFLDFLSIK